MISVRPPLSSVIDLSASTFSRALDELRRVELGDPGRADELDDPDELDEPDEPSPAFGGVLAPGNADGVGVDFGCAGAFPDGGALA